jgi:hypothetical protein
MNEHPRPDEPDDAAEAELIRKVLRTQERHREGGVDPELDQDTDARDTSDDDTRGRDASQAADAEP